MNRSNPWASDWLKKYGNEGIDGLKDRAKSDRRPELPEEIEYEIKTILMENNQGWTTKQIEELIIKKSGIKYHYTHIYRVVKKWGLKQKYRERFMLKPLLKKRRMNLKKDQPNVVDIQHQKKEFAIVSLDESFFFYDSLVRRVWIDAKKRPVVRIRCSNKLSCLL